MARKFTGGSVATMSRPWLVVGSFQRCSAKSPTPKIAAVTAVKMPNLSAGISEIFDHKLTTSAIEQSTISMPPMSSPQRMFRSSRNEASSSVKDLRGSTAGRGGGGWGDGRGAGRSGGGIGSGSGGGDAENSGATTTTGGVGFSGSDLDRGGFVPLGWLLVFYGAKLLSDGLEHLVTRRNIDEAIIVEMPDLKLRRDEVRGLPRSTGQRRQSRSGPRGGG